MREFHIRRMLFALAICIMSMQASAQTLDEVLGVRASTTENGRQSQLKIDSLAEDTRDLLTQFKTVMKVVDGLRVYNQQQRRLIANQKTEMQELDQSIDNVTVIERQITPLIERMITNLEKFI